MEVDHACPGAPASGEFVDAFVVELAGDAEKCPQPVLRSDVVARQDVEPAESTQQDVLRGPAADAVERHQFPQCFFVAGRFQLLEFEVAGHDLSSRFDHGAGLAQAEAGPLDFLGFGAGQFFGSGEDPRRPFGSRNRRSVLRRKPVQHMHAGVERNLLAGHRVDQGLEGGGKAWWLHPAQAPGDRSENTVAGGHLVEAGEIAFKAEQPVQVPADVFVLPGRDTPFDGHRKRGRIRRSGLAHRDCHRLFRNDHGPAIGRCLFVPQVGLVVHASPDRQNRVVKPERRERVDFENFHPPVISADGPRAVRPREHGPRPAR